MNKKERLLMIFGKGVTIAKLLNIPPSSVSVWDKKPIPEHHFEKLITEAEKLGYKLTVKQLRGHR